MSASRPAAAPPATAAARPTARSSARTRSCSGRTRRPPPARTAAPGRCSASRARRRSAGGSASATPRPRRCASAATPTPAGPARRPLPDFGRGRLRELPRPRLGLARHPLCGRRHATAPTSRAACVPLENPAARAAPVPRLPFRQRRRGPVRHPPDHGRRPSPDQLRARPVHRPSSAITTTTTIIGSARAPPIPSGPGRSARRWRSTARFPCSPTARGTEGIFPEFYFLDCHSCHRQISDDPRFRPGALANPGRPIPSGMPPFNDENMIMLSAAARAIAPGLAQRFERDSRAFHAAFARDRAVGGRRRPDAAAERAGARQRLHLGADRPRPRPSRSSTR